MIRFLFLGELPLMCAVSFILQGEDKVEPRQLKDKKEEKQGAYRIVRVLYKPSSMTPRHVTVLLLGKLPGN